MFMRASCSSSFVDHCNQNSHALIFCLGGSAVWTKSGHHRSGGSSERLFLLKSVNKLYSQNSSRESFVFLATSVVIIFKNNGCCESFVNRSERAWGKTGNFAEVAQQFVTMHRARSAHENSGRRATETDSYHMRTWRMHKNTVSMDGCCKLGWKATPKSLGTQFNQDWKKYWNISGAWKNRVRWLERIH